MVALADAAFDEIAAKLVASAPGGGGAA
jgi:hypothetical protein